MKKNQYNKNSDLESILKSCRKHNVLVYEYEGLRVVFGRQTKEEPLTPSAYQTKVAETQTKAIEAEALTQTSFADDEEELATMQIENPSLYEKLMIERELEDAGPTAGAKDA